MLVSDIDTDLSPELDLDTREVGPWDSSELEVDQGSDFDYTPGRHRLDTSHVSLTACEFDIDTSMCHEVFLDVPDDDSAGDSIWFFDDAGVGLSLRILAAPSRGNYWAEELCGSIVDELRSDIGDGDAHVSCDRGPYGTEISVWAGQNRQQLVVGAHTELADAMKVFATEESRAELKDYSQVADAYNHVGDVLASAAKRFGTFHNTNKQDPVTEVVDAAGQAQKKYTEMAGEMRRAADTVMNEDVDGASAIVNKVMVDEGSTQMRMHRLARPVNQPTADAARGDSKK